jgi:hypothetical protein
MKDETLHITKFGTGYHWALGVVEGMDMFVPKALLHELETHATAFDEQREANEASREHTREGKDAANARLADKASRELEPLRERIDGVRAAMFSEIDKHKAEPVSDIQQLIHEMKIDRNLRAVEARVGDDPLQAQILYRDALAAGNFAVLDAIESASDLWVGMPDAETMATLKDERSEIAEPELSEKIGDYKAAIADLDNIYQQSVRDINGVAGVVSDPITEIATGSD